jgi:Uncharacterized membrane protein (homolog of Drosophila rhomboid)
MDWSLVLISQGIESTIEQSEDLGWAIQVEPHQYAAAEQTIQQYQAENHHWRWRRPVVAEMFFDWTALGWVSLMIVFFWLQSTHAALKTQGLMKSSAVSAGEWWRLFTATCLHGDAAHLASNLSIGLLLIGLTMGRFGSGIGLLASLLAGVGGNVATWLMFPEHRSLGASGVVMGCVGLLAAQLFAFRSGAAGVRYAATGIAAGCMLFVLLGLNPNTDVLAHFGGFVSGLVLGTLLLPFRRILAGNKTNLIAAIGYALLIIIPWWLALAAPV